MTLASDYATWTAWLDGFGRGDLAPVDGLPAMSGEDLGAPAAQRLATRCGNALDARLQVWSTALDRDLGRARTAHDLRLGLLHARTRLAPIRQFAESELLFPELRDGLSEALRTAIERAQESLDRQAQSASLEAREEMLRAVRDVPLRAALDGAATPPTSLPSDGPSRPRAILLTPEADRG